MTPNSLSPASAVISYHSAFGAHKMTVPTSEWFAVGITGNLGSYLDRDGDPIDAEEMWVDFCNLARVFIPSTSVFDSVTVYTMATATSPQIPRSTVALGIAGTSALGGLSQAQSSTFNFKTEANGDFRLVLLDTPLGSQGFKAIHPADFNASVLALEAFVAGRDVAIQGRDDSGVATLRKITFDLNDKLQKQYKMSA